LAARDANRARVAGGPPGGFTPAPI